MNLQVFMLLGQDGVTNGAIYALLSLSILLVFSVTRILLIPLGEFVSYAALAMAAMQNGKPLLIGWLLLGLGVIAALMDVVGAIRCAKRPRISRESAGFLVYGIVMTMLPAQLPMASAGTAAQALLVLFLIVPLGLMMYRVFFQGIAASHSLILLIVAIAAHTALVGIGLLMFGPQGAKTAPFSDSSFQLGRAQIGSQTLWVIAFSLLLIGLLYTFFGKTLYGKALRATAVNRLGAELVGISPEIAGRISFALAALIGALSGILIAPVATIYYDSGFIIGLKGFVGAIFGGLVSYPAAALGALAMGLAESFSTFWASSYKEVIVFSLMLPVLVWISLAHKGVEEE